VKNLAPILVLLSLLYSCAGGPQPPLDGLAQKAAKASATIRPSPSYEHSLVIPSESGTRIGEVSHDGKTIYIFPAEDQLALRLKIAKDETMDVGLILKNGSLFDGCTRYKNLISDTLTDARSRGLTKEQLDQNLSQVRQDLASGGAYVISAPDYADISDSLAASARNAAAAKGFIDVKEVRPAVPLVAMIPTDSYSVGQIASSLTSLQTAYISLLVFHTESDGSGPYFKLTNGEICDALLNDRVRITFGGPGIRQYDVPVKFTESSW
jgi:hypothetical protein